MKKFILAAILLVISASTIEAQNKGDKFISPMIGLDLGIRSQKLVDNAYSEHIDMVYSPSASLAAEMGFFPINNLKVAVAMRWGIIADRFYQGSAILTNLTNMFEINPNIAYYVRITDKIFYCPEFGVSGGLGPASEAQTVSVRYNYLAADFTAYLQPINFEFRVSPHWGIGIGFGNISYGCLISADTRTGKRFATNGFYFDLSDGVWARYYF